MGEEELSEKRAFARALLLRTFIDAKRLQEMAASITSSNGQSEFIDGWMQATSMHLVQELRSAAHRLALHLGAAAEGDEAWR